MINEHIRAMIEKHKKIDKLFQQRVSIGKRRDSLYAVRDRENRKYARLFGTLKSSVGQSQEERRIIRLQLDEVTKNIALINDAITKYINQIAEVDGKITAVIKS